MNKKAVMVRFLLGLVLALIIFTMVSCVISDMVRTTGGAKESFVKFVNEMVMDLAEEGFEGEQRNYILNLDKKTAAVYFEPEYSEVTAISEGETYMFNRPGQCKPEKPCFCLFRTIREENNIFSPGKRICYSLDYKLKMEDCTPVGQEELVVCSQGFFIGRELTDFKGQRRVNIQLIKEPDEIRLIRK